MAVFSVITACYTNLAIGVTFQRDAGILKRTRGTPLPGSAYLGARVIHVMIMSILLVVICAAFGWIFYDADLPTGIALVRSIVVVLVGSASFAALGLALTPAIPNADAAPPIVNAIDPAPAVHLGHLLPRRTGRTAVDRDPERHLPGSASGRTPSWARSTGRLCSTSRGSDVGVVAAWGVVGLALAIRFFSWEPRT